MALYRAGKPTEHGFVKNFNGRMRHELLNETLFFTSARRLIALEYFCDHVSQPRGLAYDSKHPLTGPLKT